MIAFTIVGFVLVVVGLWLLFLSHEAERKLEKARDDLGRKRIGL